jgi:hypothetical protein
MQFSFTRVAYTKICVTDICFQTLPTSLSFEPWTWCQCYKTFFVRNLQIFRNKLECLSLTSLSSLV